MFLKKMKRIANVNELSIVCNSPLPTSIQKERDELYNVLSDIEFMKKYRQYLYSPALLELETEKYEIQLNFCNSIFCKWYGQTQYKYDEISGKPSRYKMVQAGRSDTAIQCNDVPSDDKTKVSLNNNSYVISNWSVAEEIKRLIHINFVVPIEPDYIFHKDGCINIDKTPFENVETFRKRGFSSSNSTKYQCKECGKITNVLPGQDESFNYHQKRNDILVQFCKLIVSHTPVKSVCEILEIGSATYYNKLNWLYRKCLEFNDRYETQVIKDKTFNELWLNTDMMVYNLNNVMHHGKAKLLYEKLKEENKSITKLKKEGTSDKIEIPYKAKKEKLPTTYIISSGDLKTGYIFRTDVAYDYNVDFESIEQDTKQFHCDHTYPFLRKNERLSYPFCPQPPTKFDNQSEKEYNNELADFNNRKNYVIGSHVKPQYTAMAHYFLIKRMLHADKWNFVSDDDSTIESCIFKMFSDKFLEDKATYFTCRYEQDLTYEEARGNANESRENLIKWAEKNKIAYKTLSDLAFIKLLKQLETHNFYGFVSKDGIKYPVRGNKPIKHPLPSLDEGIRWVNPISNIKNIDNNELAYLILQVNSRTINNFYQMVRRKITILERPLITARGDGRSYIYSNCNPKYAQELLTIFRTFYNFCWTKGKGKSKSTPAQRLGLTDKVFDYKDIVYFR